MIIHRQKQGFAGTEAARYTGVQAVKTNELGELFSKFAFSCNGAVCTHREALSLPESSQVD